MLGFILPLSLLPLLASPSTGFYYDKTLIDYNSRIHTFWISYFDGKWDLEFVFSPDPDASMKNDTLRIYAASDADHTFRSTNDNTGLYPVHPSG